MSSLGGTLIPKTCEKRQKEKRPTSFLMSGRFGRMISPLIAGILISANSIVYVWCIMAAALFTASVLTLVLAYETRGNLELASREA